jgi:hypothetical protein
LIFSEIIKVEGWLDLKLVLGLLRTIKIFKGPVRLEAA